MRWRRVMLCACVCLFEAPCPSLIHVPMSATWFVLPPQGALPFDVAPMRCVRDEFHSSSDAGTAPCSCELYSPVFPSCWRSVGFGQGRSSLFLLCPPPFSCVCAFPAALMAGLAAEISFSTDAVSVGPYSSASIPFTFTPSSQGGLGHARVTCACIHLSQAHCHG
jgi:hypothetical protein